MCHLQRLHKLQASLKNVCDVLLIEDAVNLFYLTGMHLSAGRLLVSAEETVLIVDKRYFELCGKLTFLKVWDTETHPLHVCFQTSSFDQAKTLGFDSSTTSYKNYTKLLSLAETLSLTLVPIDRPLQQLRAVKDETELQRLKDAGALGSLGFDFVLSLLKEGISEIEIANELEIFWKKHGSKGVAFSPIIAFGVNSSMPHYRAGNTQLKQGDIVLIDIGVNLDDYQSDMTRTVFFGTPDPRLLEIYEVVKQAQQAALSLCRPGVSVEALDKAARELIASHGFGPQFLHSLGHGVGLEIHEYPVIKNPCPDGPINLIPGMVITIEPGIYIPQLGGVRIEDTIAITDEGYVNLTGRSTERMTL
jgi:Xaa-Pro aminopeptidase